MLRFDCAQLMLSPPQIAVEALVELRELLSALRAPSGGEGSPPKRSDIEKNNASPPLPSACAPGDQQLCLEPSGALYDKLHISHDGYAGAVPIVHKSAAVSEVIAQLAGPCLPLPAMRLLDDNGTGTPASQAIAPVAGGTCRLHEQIDGHAEEFRELLGLSLTDAALAVQNLGYAALGQYGPEVARLHVLLLEQISEHLVRFGLWKRVRPIFVFLDRDAEQLQEPALLLGNLVFRFFHEAGRGTEQTMVFLFRANGDGQSSLEKLPILMFIE
jgi:hypothetical protein